MIDIAVFVSGGGSNLQSIIDACSSGKIRGRVKLVIGSRPGIYALERASSAGAEYAVVDRRGHEDDISEENEILDILEKASPDLICLAGYTRKIGKRVVERYRNRILNIHPALLPDFGGRGMYGIRVHEAVIDSGAAVSGCTVHIVDEDYDRGRILMSSTVPVLPGDTPRQLAARVLEEEHRLFPEAVRRYAAELGFSG